MELDLTRKNIRHLVGDLEMIETYHLCLGDLVISKIGGSRELNDIMQQI